MFEICLKRGWAVPAKAALNLCKMVEKRMFVPFAPCHLDIGHLHFHVYRWASMTPLRQFKGVPGEVIRKAEGKQFVSDDLSCMKH
jgi:pre-mRNA-splicing helicase BRR2